MSELTEDGVQKNYMVKVYVQGSYLNDNVTVERDGFYFDKENENAFYDDEEFENEESFDFYEYEMEELDEDEINY